MVDKRDYEMETEDLVKELYGLSLLLDHDLQRRTLKIHDTIRQFVRDRVGNDRLLGQHKLLLAALNTLDEAGVDAQRYLYLYRPYHLAEADERQKLDALLLDPSWLTAKLAATGNMAALVADYDHYAREEEQNLIGRTLRLTAGICTRDPRQLMPQLLGRLTANERIVETGFLKAARQQVSAPAILVRSLSLTAPGAETARLDCGHREVHALCVLPDGRLASSSDDSI